MSRKHLPSSENPQKKWIRPRTFSLHFSYQENFNNLGCFLRATREVNDLLNEIINRRTHSKGTNVFLKTSQSAFPTSSLFFMNFDLNYFFTSTYRAKAEIRERP